MARAFKIILIKTFQLNFHNKKPSGAYLNSAYCQSVKRIQQKPINLRLFDLFLHEHDLFSDRNPFNEPVHGRRVDGAPLLLLVAAVQVVAADLRPPRAVAARAGRLLRLLVVQPLDGTCDCFACYQIQPVTVSERSMWTRVRFWFTFCENLIVRSLTEGLWKS